MKNRSRWVSWRRATLVAAATLSTVLLPFSAAGQATAVDSGALLTLGRQFVARLKLEQVADATLFHDIGSEQARVLLMAIMSRGQEQTASADDWTNMHRATTGLVELALDNGELLKASVFASFQDVFYRNFEHDYGAALQASLLALDLHQRSAVPGNLHLSLAAVGRDYMSMGQAAEALHYFREAQKMAADPTEKLAAQNWRDLVLAELALKHTDDARRDVELFLAAARTAPPAFQAEAYLAKSDLLMDEGHFEDALAPIQAARQAIKLDPGATGWFEFEEVNQLMSGVLAAMTTLPYPQAIALAQRIEREFAGLPIAVGAFARQAVNMRRRLAGEIDAVLREQTAELEQAKAAGQVRAQIEDLRGIATSYQASNSIRNQIAALEEALSLEKTLFSPAGLPANPGSAYSYFRILNSLGEAYVRTRELRNARKSFDELTKTIDALPQALAKERAARAYGEAILGKAAVAELDDDPDTARELLDNALTSGAHAKAQFSVEEVLLQSARLERNLNEKPLEAAKKYAAAIAAFREKKDQNSEVAYTLEYAHFLATHAGQVPDALRLAVEQLAAAAAEADAIHFADAQWRVNYESGIVAEARREGTAAIAFYEKAVRKLDEIRAGLSQQEQRQALLDNDTVQDLYRRLIALLATNGAQAEAWRYAERAKARSFLEVLQGRRFRQTETPVTARLANLEKKIIDLRVQLSPQNENVLRGAGKQPSLLKGELLNLEAQFVFERQQEGLGKTRAGQALALDPVSLEQIRGLLPPRTELVEYVILNGRVAAFLVSREHSRMITWAVDTKALPAAVQRARSLLSTESSETDLKQALASISEMLLAPVTKALPSSTEQLVIVPSGQLNYLPFQVLPAADGRPLIDHYAISYLPSASSLQFLQDRTPLPDDLFLGALGNVSVDGMDPLPGTLRETEAISKVYRRAVRATGAGFTHSQATNALMQHAVVHFATHGLVDAQAPLFSAIVTGPAPHQPSRLSLYELTSMRLRARLVVLSACETNLGKLLGGDEVSSLTRTFLLAGANTVISSLWQVSDNSTALLMQGFYTRLHAGETPVQAMREAGLEVRKKYPHPFFWAPFVVTGIR